MSKGVSAGRAGGAAMAQQCIVGRRQARCSRKSTSDLSAGQMQHCPGWQGFKGQVL